MNPTSNKSDFEDLTTNLKDLAYSYLEKYNPSKQQLKVYLLKKYLSSFGLPHNIQGFFKKNHKIRLKKEIYKNIFLDKKKISKYPRIISIKNSIK